MSSMQDLPGSAGLPAVAPHLPAEPAGLVPPATRARHLRVVPDVPLDFDDAVRRLTPRLVRYAARRLGDVHEAEELAQEALLRAYKHRAELLTEDDLAAWSTCVTGRLVIDRLRVRGRSTSVADVPEGARVGRDTADVVVARDEARTALDALDAMPARQAAVLWAREVEGLGYDEIGARFDMTEPAVRSILTRARKALRKEYAARGGTLPAGGLAALAPWVDGFTWLDRLRSAMGRIATPAALSAAGVGLLSATVLLPHLAPAVPTPPVSLTPGAGAVSTASTVAAVRAATGDLAPHTQPAAAAPRTQAAEGALDVTRAFQGLTGAEDCVRGSSLGGLTVPLPVSAGNEACGPSGEATHVFVTTPTTLPGQNAPLTVGVEAQHVPCPTALRAAPLVGCNAGETTP